LIRKSPYEVLGLEGDFSFKDIKKAYRRAVRENPPEKNPKEFAEISNAYDMLSNEDYFMKDIEDTRFYLSVNIQISDEKKTDMGKYLKNIFEVPFLI